MQEIHRRQQTKPNRLSLIILSKTGKQVKQFNASLVFLLLLILSIASGVSLLGFFLYDYHNMRTSITTLGQMAQKVIDQREEITQQRLQIQTFADEINSLKDKLVKLNQFEEKLRVIANLEPAEGKTNLFGVGGATPEDLDTQRELNEGHESLIREMHQQINDLESASLRQSDSFDTLKDKLEDQRNLLASTPAIRPTRGWMTSRFGYRTSPFTGRREFHKGVDIANRKGTAIVATADGVVTFVGKKNNMGRVVVIDHGHGMITRYAHLSDTLKRRGDKVKRGNIIAQMGNTGRSTGPHLHYEVHLNGVPVNPEKYILN
jgi:murein DD-endopeptidase MepM/ murein hydrolase activator NlpD